MGVAQLKMPQLGESVTEGTVDRWLKKEGDYVRRDEPIVEVVTDKVNAEIPSPRRPQFRRPRRPPVPARGSARPFAGWRRSTASTPRRSRAAARTDG